MNSDAGDYIGQGQTYRFGPPGHEISWSGTPERLTLLAGGFHADFEAPDGQVLSAGVTYSARRYPFNGGGAGLNVDGQGRGCNVLTGSFTVDEIAFASDYTLRTFKVRFEQHCENAQPALRGTWDVPHDLTVGSGRCGRSPARSSPPRSPPARV